MRAIQKPKRPSYLFAGPKCRSGGTSGYPIKLSDPGFQLLENESFLQLFEDQIELIERTQDLYETVAGDPEWWAVPVEELLILEALLASIDEAMLTESPSGVVISGEEATALSTLPRPSNLTENHLNALIDRFNRFATGGMTDQEQSAVVQTATSLRDFVQMLEASGWETTYDGFIRGMAALSAESDAQIIGVKQSKLYYKLTNLNSGFTRRGRLNAQGEFNNLIIVADTHYVVEYVDPDTLEIGIAVFASPEAGNNVEIPRAFLTASSEPDSDLDGLPDDIEEVVGTDPLNPDTDGDGIKDGAELQQGFNALEGVIELPKLGHVIG